MGHTYIVISYSVQVQEIICMRMFLSYEPNPIEISLEILKICMKILV